MWFIPYFGKCRYARNTALLIQYGLEQLTGAGFVPLYVSQGTGFIMHLLKSWKTPHQQIGQVLQAMIAWTQYQAGIKESIFVDTNTPIEFVDGHFCPAARNYSNDIDATIDLFPNYVQKPLQVNDETIMGRVNMLTHFTDVQCEYIICVRMYLGVNWISELATIDGRYLIRNIGSPSFQRWNTSH